MSPGLGGEYVMLSGFPFIFEIVWARFWIVVGFPLPRLKICPSAAFCIEEFRMVSVRRRRHG